MNHITLETAKKLRSMGWDKETEFNFYGGYDDSVGGYCLEVSHSDFADEFSWEAFFPAPTCEELLEVLPKQIEEYYLSMIYNGTQWRAYYESSGLGNLRIVWNDDLTEALALLLIELVEQGVVDRDSLTDKK